MAHSFARGLRAAMRNRNDLIHSARDTTLKQGSMHHNEVRSTLHLQTSMADAECLNSSELFDTLIDIEKRLEAINDPRYLNWTPFAGPRVVGFKV
jgi:hypothetical protein